MRFVGGSTLCHKVLEIGPLDPIHPAQGGGVFPASTRRRLRQDSAQALLKYILHDPDGPLYVMHPEHPEYVRATRLKEQGEILTRFTFAMRANQVDDVFLARVKELATADRHLGEHIKTSVVELEKRHTEAVISVVEHLTHVRTEIEKTMALLYGDILSLTPQDKVRYNGILEGLRAREAELITAQKNLLHESLQDDLRELATYWPPFPPT